MLMLMLMPCSCCARARTTALFQLLHLRGLRLIRCTHPQQITVT